MIALTICFKSFHRIIIAAITGETPDEILEPGYEKDVLKKSNSVWHTFIFLDQTAVSNFIEKAKNRPEFNYIICQRNLDEL